MDADQSVVISDLPVTLIFSIQWNVLPDNMAVLRCSSEIKTIGRKLCTEAQVVTFFLMSL